MMRPTEWNRDPYPEVENHGREGRGLIKKPKAGWENCAKSQAGWTGQQSDTGPPFHSQAQ